MHATPKVRRKEICYVTSQRWRFFLHSWDLYDGAEITIFLVGGVWVVTAVELESSTGETRTWRWQLSLEVQLRLGGRGIGLQGLQGYLQAQVYQSSWEIVASN